MPAPNQPSKTHYGDALTIYYRPGVLALGFGHIVLRKADFTPALMVLNMLLLLQLLKYTIMLNHMKSTLGQQNTQQSNVCVSALVYMGAQRALFARLVEQSNSFPLSCDTSE